MNCSLNENDLKRHISTESLPLLDADDPAGEQYLCQENACTYAEVTDSFQLSQLLHRKYYQPVAAIRHRGWSSAFIRVYFLGLHCSEFVEPVVPDSEASERSAPFEGQRAEDASQEFQFRVVKKDEDGPPAIRLMSETPVATTWSLNNQQQIKE